MDAYLGHLWERGKFTTEKLSSIIIRTVLTNLWARQTRLIVASICFVGPAIKGRYRSHILTISDAFISALAASFAVSGVGLA